MSEGAAGSGVVQRRLEILNRLGLHARAATLLVQTVATYDAEIRICKEDQVVNGKSIIGLMMLAAGKGSQIEVTAEGPDACAAVDAIAALVQRRFDEDE